MSKRIFLKKMKYIGLGIGVTSLFFMGYIFSIKTIGVKNASAVFVEQALQTPEVDLDQSLYSLCHVPEMAAYFYVDRDTTDSIKKHLQQGLYWEGTIGNLIKKYTAYGSIAIDIGAHIGIHTITMSRKVGPQGKVISFEPQKKMYRECLHNLSVNQCTNVIAMRKAVGDSERTIHMEPINAKNEGGCAIGVGGDEAEMITLDSLHLKGVSLIKVDVERYELFVFQGMRETILANKPVLIFEVMGEHDYVTATPEVRKCFDDVIEYVKSLNYDVRQIFGNDYIAFPLDHNGDFLVEPTDAISSNIEGHRLSNIARNEEMDACILNLNSKI
jgi:FkbM family methyltransferase